METQTPTSQRVAELIDNGWTVLEISHALRISPQAVYKHLHRQGLTPHPAK